MDNPNGQPISAVNQPEVAGTQPEATPSAIDLSQFQADPVNTATGTPPVNPQVQPQATPEQEFVPKSQFNEYQKMHQESILAERERNRILMEQLNSVVNAVKPPPTIPDKVTNPVEYLEWNTKEAMKQMLVEARKIYQDEFNQTITQVKDIQWQNEHPTMDINLVKQWASQNGVTNLDHAVTLMTLPQQRAQVAQNSAQQAFNQFRQPQNGTTPVRNTSPVQTPQAGLSFEKMLVAVEKNPALLETVDPAIRAEFNRQLSIRAGM